MFRNILTSLAARNSRLLCHNYLVYRQQGTTLSDLHMEMKESYMEMKADESSSVLHLNYLWLRDHCRCDSCYTHQTHQRSLAFMSLPHDVRPVEFYSESGKLTIQWSDNHISNYNLSWLTKFSQSKRDMNSLFEARLLWSQQKPNSVPAVNYKELLTDQRTVKEALSSLLELGVVTINQVPATLEGTRLAVEAIAPVQRTFFGGIWEFGNDAIKDSVHADTAYTNYYLAPHNDGTYFTESPGLQVFHCLGRSEDSTGGDTLLVDGFSAIHELQQTNKEAFKIMSSVSIESEYIEEGRHFLSAMPVIVLDPLTKRVLQIRMNLYDRAPMRTFTTPHETAAYYQALRELAQLVLQENFEMRIKLMPGTVLIIDNWRVLHGRTEYKGRRHISGCYVSRSDWLSRARVMELLK